MSKLLKTFWINFDHFNTFSYFGLQKSPIVIVFSISRVYALQQLEIISFFSISHLILDKCADDKAGEMEKVDTCSLGGSEECEKLKDNTFSTFVVLSRPNIIFNFKNNEGKNSIEVRNRMKPVAIANLDFKNVHADLLNEHPSYNSNHLFTIVLLLCSFNEFHIIVSSILLLGQYMKYH